MGFLLVDCLSVSSYSCSPPALTQSGTVTGSCEQSLKPNQAIIQVNGLKGQDVVFSECGEGSQVGVHRWRGLNALPGAGCQCELSCLVAELAAALRRKATFLPETYFQKTPCI